MLRAYKYRIYPTEGQRHLIDKTIGCCRLIYNLALETKITAYKNAGINLRAFDLCYQLVEMKSDFAWLKEVDSQALQASVKKVDVAFKNFYKGSGYPNFKKKTGRQSFQCPNEIRRIDFDKQLLTIPKIKNIPIRVSRIFSGKIKTITISRETTGKYYASILVDNGKELPKKCQSKDILGIDLGIKHLAITSDGLKIDNPKYLANTIERIKVLSKRLRNKKLHSKNYKKAQQRIALLHGKIAFQRKDYLHKISTQLVNNHDTIVFETLRIKNMVKNHKLSKAINDVGWSMFTDFCKYKCDWAGKNFIQIPTFYASTKICSKCETRNETLTLADRQWLCANCGTHHDRDINAAKNIKQYYSKNSGMGNAGAPVEQSEMNGCNEAGITAKEYNK